MLQLQTHYLIRQILSTVFLFLPILTTSLSSTTSSNTCTTSTTTIPNNEILSPANIQSIDRGGVAIIPNFIPSSLITALHKDAHYLFSRGEFTPDGLTNTALSKDQQGFKRNTDRQTFRGGADWNDDSVGNYQARQEFSIRIDNLRMELAKKLKDRPTLAINGEKRHEMTYNWYENGAKLGRHLDEHHEETKGVKGWILPTRRSVTWLVYLNTDWEESEGGALRCYPRNGTATNPVGSHEGNLQVGWIDHLDPIYLDCFRSSGGSALYHVVKDGQRVILSENDFDIPRQPIEFGRFLKEEYRHRFEQISTARLDPRFVNTNNAIMGGSSSSGNTNNDDNNHYLQASLLADKEETHHLDVIPTGGTLVLFDSVSLPHLVREVTSKRQRIAATGWFHEDSTFLLQDEENV